MGFFGAKKPVLNDAEKKKILADVSAAIKTGGNSDDLRPILARSMNKSGDDAEVTALLKDITFYGLPDAEKKQKVDFFSWWAGLDSSKRADAIDNATAWITSK